ncbi:MAG: GNAT family N-acetyltransferase [Bdellovibrionales bacterium]
MITGPTVAATSDYENVLDFLNNNLRPEQGWSIDKEYPTAINPHNHLNMHIVKDGDNIVSHALTRDLMIKSPISLFKVTTIGSVVTDEKYRNKGLSKATIENCLEASREKGCDFAILWSDLHNFYSKIGFELAGSEISYVINKPLPEATEPLRVIEGNKISAQAIADLYNKHTVVSLRNASDIQKYLAIPEMRVYTAWDSNNKLRAYAIEGKGVDLSGYIHEWGGNVTDLLSLISHMQKTQNKTYTLIAPMHSQNLHRQMQSLGFQPHHGYLGMIKIINPKSLFLKISNYARSVGIPELIIRQDDENEYAVGTEKNLYNTNSLSDMTQLIFGPHHPDQLKDFDNETRHKIENILPLPMWIWGWDSI